MSKEVIEYFSTAPLQYCKHTQTIVDKIMQHEAVQAFDGELLIGFETQTEPANPDANFLGSTTMHGTYDAKTGEKKN